MRVVSPAVIQVISSAGVRDPSPSGLVFLSPRLCLLRARAGSQPRLLRFHGGFLRCATLRPFVQFPLFPAAVAAQQAGSPGKCVPPRDAGARAGPLASFLVALGGTSELQGVLRSPPV